MTSKLWAELWAERHQLLVQKLQKLEKRMQDEWGFKRIYIKPTRVRAHQRKGYYTMVAVKPKKKK